MKVLIINDYAATIGGAERFLENLLYESQHAAIDFHRLNITDLVQGSGTAAWSNVITDRMRRIRVIPEIVSRITHQVELIKPDLIHLNNNHLYTNSVVQSLRSSGIPVVWFVHDECTLRRMRSVFYVQTNNSFTFLTHSPQIYNGLTSMQRKAYLVKVPFNHTKLTLPPEEVIRHRSSDLLYVGRIEKSKGIFTLVKAVDLIKAKVSSINLTILGDGSQLKALESMVKARKLTHNIRIIGLQEDQELRRYYASARILVFPSGTETLGYVGLEAQACGTPVIAFKNEGTIRWCRDNVSGFIVQGTSPQKLADKVLEIIHDDVILTRISTAARENIRLEGYNASSHEVPDIYKAILSW